MYVPYVGVVSRISASFHVCYLQLEFPGVRISHIRVEIAVGKGNEDGKGEVECEGEFKEESECEGDRECKGKNEYESERECEERSECEEESKCQGERKRKREREEENECEGERECEEERDCKVLEEIEGKEKREGEGAVLVGVLNTQWEQSVVDLDQGLDFTPRGRTLTSFTHLTHDDFHYV